MVGRMLDIPEQRMGGRRPREPGIKQIPNTRINSAELKSCLVMLLILDMARAPDLD